MDKAKRARVVSLVTTGDATADIESWQRYVHRRTEFTDEEKQKFKEKLPEYIKVHKQRASLAIVAHKLGFKAEFSELAQ